MTRSKAILTAGVVGLVASFAAVQIWARTAPRPEALGVRDGGLAPCPDRPNCVRSTEAGGGGGDLPHVGYSTSRDAARSQLLAVLQSMPRATIVAQEPDYIHAEFRSAVFGFVDDAEFYLDPSGSAIQLRSAARCGHSDLGVNRRRLDQIIDALADRPSG